MPKLIPHLERRLRRLSDRIEHASDWSDDRTGRRLLRQHGRLRARLSAIERRRNAGGVTAYVDETASYYELQPGPCVLASDIPAQSGGRRWRRVPPVFAPDPAPFVPTLRHAEL